MTALSFCDHMMSWIYATDQLRERYPDFFRERMPKARMRFEKNPKYSFLRDEIDYRV